MARTPKPTRKAVKSLRRQPVSRTTGNITAGRRGRAISMDEAWTMGSHEGDWDRIRNDAREFRLLDLQARPGRTKTLNPLDLEPRS